MTSSSVANYNPGTRFQCTYGVFQKRYWWMIGIVWVIGLVGAPMGIFWNQGWEAGGHPLEPWAATMIIEIFAVGSLLLASYMTYATWRRKKSPQRIAVTSSGLLIPRGFSRELVLPFSEIKTTVFDVGFVKQLQIMHGRRKILLTSALFPSDSDFDRFVSYLPK